MSRTKHPYKEQHPMKALTPDAYREAMKVRETLGWFAVIADRAVRGDRDAIEIFNEYAEDLAADEAAR